MKVLKATNTQRIALEGTYFNGAVLQFIQDANNDYVVNESVLIDPNFEAIHEQLASLPKIDYLPKQLEGF